MPKIIERHQDYLFRLGTSLADGATVRNRTLALDQDAPFCLRGIGAYNVAADVATQLFSAFLQWSDHQGTWMSSELEFTDQDILRFGGDCLYEPIYPQIVYPAGSTIEFQLTNVSGAAFDDARVVLRGVKLYHEGQIWSPTYPECYSSIPYEQSVQFTAASGETRLSQPILAQGADFVCRTGILVPRDQGGVADVVTGLQVRLRDAWGQPYSNDLIHAAWLFNANLLSLSFSTGAHRPGIFYPEIYIPKDEQIFYDFVQPAVGQARMNLVLGGARIFPKRA